MEINYSKFRLAIRLIGCNIETYGHFDTYMVPDDTGCGIPEKDAKEFPNTFLQNVENYYRDKKIINQDYGNDAKEQNMMKKFLMSKEATERTYQLGELWVKNNLESKA